MNPDFHPFSAICKTAGFSEEKQPSAINAAEYALEQARELSSRVQSLAERILGATPQAVPTTGISPNIERMGVFPLLQASSERTSSVISEGFDAINRIERSLP